MSQACDRHALRPVVPAATCANTTATRPARRTTAGALTAVREPEVIWLTLTCFAARRAIPNVGAVPRTLDHLNGTRDSVATCDWVASLDLG
jgi:hypothetical protein